MKHVLLVDDSATMLMSLRGTLEISGFKVETAGDGEEAQGKDHAQLLHAFIDNSIRCGQRWTEPAPGLAASAVICAAV